MDMVVFRRKTTQPMYIQGSERPVLSDHESEGNLVKEYLMEDFKRSAPNTHIINKNFNLHTNNSKDSSPSS